MQISSGAKVLSKISVNMALEAPPEDKIPSGTTDLTRKRRHPGGSSTGPSPHVEPLFSSCGKGTSGDLVSRGRATGLVSWSTGKQDTGDPYFSEFRGRGCIPHGTSLRLPSHSGVFSSWVSKYHRPRNPTSAGRWLFAFIAAR